MTESAQDRKLPATPRRIQKARTEGQVARSRDLGHFAALSVGVALAAALAPQALQGTGELLQAGLRFDASLLLDPAAMLGRLGELGGQMMWLLWPLFAAVVVVALLSGVVAGGWNLSWEPLAPKFSKINPFSGLMRVFSAQQLTETLKSCLLALVMGGVGALYLRGQWMHLAELLTMPLPAAMAAGSRILFGGLLLLAGVLGLFALVDVPLQRFMLGRRLRMSDQEVRQEHKEIEGNPEIKGRLKSRMREMASKRMLAAVPGADLVIMNPSHYAVALKYDEATMAAPRVVAKGADLVALRIRDLARDAKVPVLQAPALARALYAHTELDQEVPARLFSAVAQVLAWVFQLREAMASGRQSQMSQMAQPQPEVPADMDPHHPTALAKAPRWRARRALRSPPDPSSDPSSGPSASPPPRREPEL